MPFDIVGADDYRRNYLYDDGTQNPLKGYPIIDKAPDNEMFIDLRIQNTATIHANITAAFVQWFQSFFEPGYFKHVAIKTQMPFTVFKSFMFDIYKKDKPILVIDPRPAEIDEQFLYAQNMLNRYNLIDPDHDNAGAKVAYSHRILKTDKFELKYRPNRFRFNFDIMITEQTQNRQENTFNMMLANIRHRSKFMLTRVMPLLVPTRYIMNIAKFHGYDWRSDDFLKFLNSYSKYPFKKEIRNNGRLMYFMLKEVHLQFETPDFPAKDGVETSDAIEWGARIVDQFVIGCDLPLEFLFLTGKEYVHEFMPDIDNDPDSITWISPVHKYLNWPTEFGSEGQYKLLTRVDAELQEGDDDCTLDITQLIKDADEGVYNVIQHWIMHDGNIGDLVQVHVWPDGEWQEIGCQLNQNGVVEILAPELNKIYVVSIYINLETINLMRQGEQRRHIGTIEIDRSPE